jgi:hypothetical protein
MHLRLGELSRETEKRVLWGKGNFYMDEYIVTHFCHGQSIPPPPSPPPPPPPPPPPLSAELRLHSPPKGTTRSKFSLFGSEGEGSRAFTYSVERLNARLGRSDKIIKRQQCRNLINRQAPIALFWPTAPTPRLEPGQSTGTFPTRLLHKPHPQPKSRT